jgi:hypothetical protein
VTSTATTRRSIRSPRRGEVTTSPNLSVSTTTLIREPRPRFVVGAYHPAVRALLMLTEIVRESGWAEQ